MPRLGKIIKQGSLLHIMIKQRIYQIKIIRIITVAYEIQPVCNLLEIYYCLRLMTQRLSQISNALTSTNRLQTIRKQTSLDTEQLKDILYGPGSFNLYIKPIFDYMDSNRQIYSHQNIQSYDRKEYRKQSARMVLGTMKHVKLDLQNKPFALPYTQYAIGSLDLSLNAKISVHFLLYTNSLLLYASHPKHQEYFQRASTFQDMGCFGLTEFHHGSYSKGIQTKAFYDHHTRSFLLSTEGSKGMKFWIGGAAEVMTMSVIWAQLIVNGVSQGPHPFVVPLRCKQTHKVLPGITIGDCGPKNGGDGIDNGYIMLENVRVPVEDLLGKFGWIDEFGKYQSKISNKDRRFGMHMSALSSGRGLISFRINSIAINALTIALRYACTRKQFQNYTKDDEINIIDYPITQIRIMPHFAKIILQIAGGEGLARSYFSIDKPFLSDEAYGAELHAVSSAVKSSYTSNVANITSECRTVLGGHGYSAYSAMDRLFHSADVNTTWEGDNNVLLMQTSKYLMKVIGNKAKTKILDLSFVHQSSNIDLQKMEENLRNMNTIEALLKDLFRVKYTIALAKTKELSKIYKDKQQAESHFHPEAGNSLSLTYADYYTFTVGKSKVASAKSSSVKQFIQNCLFLWAFTLLQKERYGSHDLRKAIQKEIIKLCEELVNASVLVTDAITPSSFVIGSPFADFNGDGFKEYLNILYTKKDTFTRSHYYQDIKAAKLP